MAKVTSPLGSSEARGKIGGRQHNTWRGISFVKDTSSPAQPRSQLQLKIRAWTTMLVRRWATLTATNRANWNDYAATHTEIDWTGNPKRLTGLNWYVRCGIRMFFYTGATNADPPSTAAPDAPIAFAAADGVLTSICTWTAYAGADKRVEVYLVGPHSKGMLAKVERAKYNKDAAGSAGTVTLTPLQVGRYTMFARAVDQDNGLSSPWMSDTADITAV